ncbi:MAG TPA: beta-N-acetylhexosaminidase [Rhizomicrobium sp.]|nr:beta-N-acetylhexosaminidase [Rhizomicrobium sp.]
MTRTRAIYGCAGIALTADECAFYADAQPWGFILFARNIADRAQVKRLVASLRETIGDPRAPVLIDQEGGRVARLKPPQWQARPAAGRFALLHNAAPEAAHEAAYLNARLIAYDLAELGINVDCVPVLDVPVDGADAVIGDRAYGRDPTVIIELGRSVIEGMIEGGVLPVMKHIPGHGRATADTHHELPHVTTSREELSATDFVTFRSLSDCPMAMTAHVVYDAIDPQRPATTSPRVIKEIIRGEIGFDGLLMSDDLSMNALAGTLAQRAKASLFAGCDVVLHCNGSLDEMKQVAGESKPLDDVHLRRAQAALARLTPADAFDARAGSARLDELLGKAA